MKKQRRRLNKKGWLLIAIAALLVVAMSVFLYPVLTGKTTIGSLMPAKKIVSLYVDGSPYAQLQVIVGKADSIPTYISKNGYVFKGWAYEDGSMYDPQAGVKKGHRIDLFAVFTPITTAEDAAIAAAAEAAIRGETTIDISYTVDGK